MPSMIESLIGAGVARPDNKRLVPTRRPLPGRPRDLFELFVTLGTQSSLPALMEACDLRTADPRHMTYVVLSRWPDSYELAEQPETYVVRNHLRALLLGEEFRASLIRRICDAYPERQRLLYVRIPRCAGQHFLEMANAMHAIVPAGLETWEKGDQHRFIPALGSYLGRFNLTRTIQIVLPRLAPFIQMSSPPARRDKSLNWYLNPPPRRPGDRLFTILRDPASLVLSQVNGILTSLQSDSTIDTPAIDAWRIRLGALPPREDLAGWKALGAKVLGTLPVRDPICTALGDGTADDALEIARTCDLEICDFSRYADWVKYTWDVEPEPAPNASLPILTQADLDADAASQLESMIVEDRIFYERVMVALGKLGDLKTAIRGRDL